MRILFGLALAALASCSFAAAIPNDTAQIVSRGVPSLTSLTTDEVDKMDLYASYSASAACNIDTPAGEPVTCYQNCDRAQADGAIILNTFSGPITEFKAYMAVVPSRKQIVWVGRSSVDFQNWCTDFNFTLLPSDLVDGGKVHAGFQTAWLEIANPVMDAVKNAVEQHPDYNLVITGASLGGAVGTLIAANLRSAGYKTDLYTYGTPRIGNDILSDFISNQPGAFYRVTHNQDPVPRLPPTHLLPDWFELIFGPIFKEYAHTTPEYWLTGRPADPDHWPVGDIKRCDGNASRDCIDNPDNDWDLTLGDHLNYFGSLLCEKPRDPSTAGTVIPAEFQEFFGALAGSVKSENRGDAIFPPVCNFKY